MNTILKDYGVFTARIIMRNIDKISRYKISKPESFKEGIFNFKFPFMSHDMNITYVDVQLHIGREGVNKSTPYLITSILRTREENYPGLTSSIEELCTKIRLSFFDTLLDENVEESRLIHESMIRWVEVIPTSNPNIKSWSKVKMKWSQANKCYHSPEWFQLKPLI